MEENNSQAIEAARLEIAMLQAEIETLKARKSMVECVREPFSQVQPVNVLKRKARRKTIGSKEPPQVEVTLLETDYELLMKRAQSAVWVERKLSDLKQLGDRLWHQLNQKEILKAAIQRAETAERRCRALEKEIEQLTAPPIYAYDLDDGADREIDYPNWDDREF